MRFAPALDVGPIERIPSDRRHIEGIVEILAAAQPREPTKFDNDYVFRRRHPHHSYCPRSLNPPAKSLLVVSVAAQPKDLYFELRALHMNNMPRGARDALKGHLRLKAKFGIEVACNRVNRLRPQFDDDVQILGGARYAEKIA